MIKYDQTICMSKQVRDTKQIVLICITTMYCIICQPKEVWGKEAHLLNLTIISVACLGYFSSYEEENMSSLYGLSKA